MDTDDDKKKFWESLTLDHNITAPEILGMVLSHGGVVCASFTERRHTPYSYTVPAWI